MSLDPRNRRTVPFFKYPHVFCSVENEILEIVRDVGRRGAFILQKDVQEFEAHLAEYLGTKYVLGVGNATDALFLGLKAAGIGPGDEVIFCTHTFVATAGAIHSTGATPVPVECGPDHLMDPDSVKEAITPKTRAIMPTQLNGRTADMDALQAIADEHGLLIFEDSAQALGSKFKGRCAGTFGVAGVFSFYPAKNLGALGDAGALVTNDEAVYKKAKMMRDHGRDEETGDVVVWGINSRLDNIHAAILDHKFKSYDIIVQRRREIAAIYQERLADISELVLPPGPDADPDHFDVFQNYEIEAERRDELKAHLAEHGVGTMVQWGGKPVHLFRKLGFTQSLPYTEALFERLLMLPMNDSLTDEDVVYVCEVVRDFYGA